MVARTLITTAIEETWPKDKNEPVLFLGEWCKLYNRKSIWRDLNANTEPYHWDDREKLHADYLYLQKLHEELTVELAVKLNEIHSVNHSIRYWKILIGPWLGYFTQMLFDRWFMLKQSIEKSNITTCKVIQRELISVVPNDMASFNKIFVEDDWNEAIYGQLIERCWPELMLIERVQLQKMGKAEPVKIQKGWYFNSFQKNKTPKTPKKITKIRNRIINAGMDANAHFTINLTMSSKGISKFFTWTNLSSLKLFLPSLRALIFLSNLSDIACFLSFITQTLPHQLQIYKLSKLSKLLLKSLIYFL